MTQTRVILKTADGAMGFLNIEVEDDYPDELTNKRTGRKAILRDWAGQFGGGSIPVYEEVDDEG